MLSQNGEGREKTKPAEKRSAARKDQNLPVPSYQEEFESFYKQYYQIVLGYLVKKTSRSDDAEDLAGKVFLYCFENWSSYDENKASRKTWLFLIVRSRWIDYLRRRREMTNLDEIAELAGSDDSLMDRALQLETLRGELAEALEKIPESQRKAIVMRFFGQIEDREIARRLQTTENNVRVLIHRGLIRLRSVPSLQALFMA